MITSLSKQAINHLWRSMKISDELNKVGIEIHPTTVYKIIQTFRKIGTIKKESILSGLHYNYYRLSA